MSDEVTKHITKYIQSDMCYYVGTHQPARECCVNMSCFQNDWNDLILLLLNVPVACYGGLHKDWANKPFLADCTPHSTFCWSFRGRKNAYNILALFLVTKLDHNIYHHKQIVIYFLGPNEATCFFF